MSIEIIIIANAQGESLASLLKNILLSAYNIKTQFTYTFIIAVNLFIIHVLKVLQSLTLQI